MTRLRWIGLSAALLVAGIVLGTAVGFGPYVRGKIAEKAARRGAVVVVEQLRPTWGGVRLRNLSVTFEAAPGVSVQLDEVDVDASPWTGVSAVRVSGGEVALEGELEALEAQSKALLRRNDSGGGAAGAAAKEISVAGLGVRWASPRGDSARATGLALTRRTGGWETKVATFEVAHAKSKISGTGASFALAADAGAWRCSAAHADSVTVVLETPAVEGGAEVGPPGGGAEEAAAVGKARAARQALGRAAVALGVVLSPEVEASVDRLDLELRRDGQTLHIGPDSLRVRSTGDGLDVALTPSEHGETGTPLLVSAKVPVAVDQPLAVSMQGGPVTLAALGVRAGNLGLLDVDKATLEAGGKIELAADSKHVEVALHGRVRGLSLENAKLASQPVKGLDVGFDVQGGAELDGTHVRVDRGELDVGTVHAELSGEVARQVGVTSVRGSFAIPLASCQGLLDAMPSGLAPILSGVKAAGTFALRGKIAFDSQHADATTVDLDLLNECRVTHATAAIDVARFRAPYRRKVYGPDGERVEIESGPGTAGWAPFASISPFMEAAVETTEDGRFRFHRGFDVEAIRNSIRENLKAGKFLRGASTISMQTAKNVYLEREKTLSRKLEEAFLTSYLEQEMSKEQILELYLNSIEFGPMIYGIGPAAAHYFHTSPAELSLGQALYLSSILPNPKVQHFADGGRVSPQWMGYLHKLMKMMLKRHLIDDTDLAEGLGEWVVFGQAKPLRSQTGNPDDVEGAPPEDVQP